MGFRGLLSVCATEGETSEAFRVYEEMLAAGFEADATGFAGLLSSCLQQGDLDTAARLLGDDALKAPREMLELFMPLGRARCP